MSEAFCKVSSLILLFLTNSSNSESILVGEENPYVTNFCEEKCGYKKNICCLYSTKFFGTDCGDMAYALDLDEPDVKAILHTHNKLRDEVAAGKSGRDDMQAITASDMRVLSYSKELSYSAKCWAMQCKFGHSRCRSIKEGLVGETLCWDSALKMGNSTVEKSRRLLDRCAQIQYHNFPKLSSQTIDSLKYPQKGDDERNRETIQVIWAETQYMGCARVAFPHMDPLRKAILLVCHFYPAGNVLNKPVFIRGQPASNCQDNEARNENYENLCGDIRPVNDDYWLGPVKGTNSANSASTSLLLLFTFQFCLLYKNKLGYI